LVDRVDLGERRVDQPHPLALLARRSDLEAPQARARAAGRNLIGLALCLVLSSSSLEDEAAAAPEQAVSVEPQNPDRVGRVAAELGAALLGLVLPNILWMPFLAA